MSMIVKVDDPYLMTKAFGYQSNDQNLLAHTEMVSNKLSNMLTTAGQSFYTGVSKVNEYINSNTINQQLQEIKDTMFTGENPYMIYSYNESNYMHITSHMQDVVMTNPHLYGEFVEGDITGFNRTDDTYDELLYKRMYNGIGDHTNDTSFYMDSSDVEDGLDNLMKVHDVWEFFVKGLEDGDDFTDI